MALSPGQRLGSYEVVAQIGAGGMGEVYRAHDSKLGRDVAIKVLPANFVDDPERLARLQREARMLAALNHPNVATLYGLEQSCGTTCLVMELVPGETLADRVKAGPLPALEAVARKANAQASLASPANRVRYLTVRSGQRLSSKLKTTSRIYHDLAVVPGNSDSRLCEVDRIFCTRSEKRDSWNAGRDAAL